MKHRSLFNLAICLAAVCLATLPSLAQGTLEDYERAQGLQSKYQALAISLPGPATWFRLNDHFWYRRTVKDGSEIVWVDAASLTRRPAFDHERLAISLSEATGEKYTGLKLP